MLLPNVLKYSPSSTCVPSDSNTNETFSFCGTPSFSLPKSNRVYVRPVRRRTLMISKQAVQRYHSTFTIIVTDKQRRAVTKRFLITQRASADDIRRCTLCRARLHSAEKAASQLLRISDRDLAKIKSIRDFYKAFSAERNQCVRLCARDCHVSPV